ncbi:ATP-binding protein [Streptomyces sp. NPDC058385]|uniref:ATP-binding protein n=1 Tax=Streptomyces sp. NPDC058385 TaxID=3346473 RepID=UPI00364BB835
MPVTLSACPAHADRTAPTPENLTYSLTLPSALTSPAMARAATRTLLAAHGLRDILDAALLAIAELTATACQFTASPEVYVSLRYREDALRLITYDSHPRHENVRVAAACEARRRAALRLLACVTRTCGGDWGFGPAREPEGGTRMWVTLPRTSTVNAYGAVGDS